MRLAVCWPITYWSSSSAISCGVGRSDFAPATDSTLEVSSRMMSLHRSMHSSQMKTEGPAMSFLTSCWLLPQKEQYRSFSPLDDFLSDMGRFLLNCFEYNANTGAQQVRAHLHATRNKKRTPEP